MLRYFADRLFSPASLPTSTPGAAASSRNLRWRRVWMMSRFVRSLDTSCVGAAQQLTLNGVQLLPIMRAGRLAQREHCRALYRERGR